MKNIQLIGATEGNLKNISLTIPRNKLTVLTGVSGSGKSTLALDVIFQECQRQYLEAISLQGIRKPGIERLKGASPAVLITAAGYSRNPRSTVGTVTEIYTELRMIYEKLGQYPCPLCGEMLDSAECREQTEKKGDDFYVYLYCSHCGKRIDRLTQTHFSFNTREGACPSCRGLGEIMTPDRNAVLNEELSPEEGAVSFWEKRYGEFQTGMFYQALQKIKAPVRPGTPVKDYNPLQKGVLLEGMESGEVKKLSLNTKNIKFEGVFPNLWRRFTEKDGAKESLKKYFITEKCPVCRGERLNPAARAAVVADTRLPELTELSLKDLSLWIRKLEEGLPESHKKIIFPYILDLKTKTDRLNRVGLSYLTPDRQTMTLSGGEAQRMKLASALDSDLTGIIYIMDEPTAGLHSQDTQGIIKVLKELRDKENTVLIIEHDTEVMRAADYIVDIGPGSGRHGGEITGRGTFEEILNQGNTLTGKYLKLEEEGKLYSVSGRTGDGGHIIIENAGLHNLKNIRAELPTGCLTVVTGVSGSGKSTLIFDILAEGQGRTPDGSRITGLDRFDRIITVGQAPLNRMNRSNVATYCGVYDKIRTLFAKQPGAEERGLNAGSFSFNSGSGRCEHCEGLGYVNSNMLFFEDLKIPCPVCGGRQFKDQVLEVTYKNKTIRDVLKTSIADAIELFREERGIIKYLKLLSEAGLDYPELGQTLTTLSAGEGQRLKLARELSGSRKQRNLYLIDEPTNGLHPYDVENFLKLLNRLTEEGNTVIAAEHNLQFIRSADWVIDLGPGGGEEGGRLIAEGTPEELRHNPASVTGKFI